MNRRHFITGIAGILATATAPAIITTPGLLMPVRRILIPGKEMLTFFEDTIIIDQLRQMNDELKESVTRHMPAESWQKLFDRLLLEAQPEWKKT